MVGENRNDQKLFRRALRADEACQKWHNRNERWKVLVGSAEHKDMQRVLREWKSR